jgi:hypothetical protein
MTDETRTDPGRIRHSDARRAFGSGCSCFQSEPLESVAQTDAVFRARAVTAVMVLTGDDGKVVYDSQTGTGSVQQIVALRVEEVFKGDVAPITLLVTGSGGGDCGYGFEEGKEYVVFANVTREKRMTALVHAPNVLTTSICSSTRPAADATDLLTALAKKFPPKKAFWISRPFL